MRILVINPGSTSTKIAVYSENSCLMVKSILHSSDELKDFGLITDQYGFRLQLILNELKAESIPLDFDAVIGRGGLTKPLEGGVYEVNDQMVDDMFTTTHHHACNLGCILARDIARDIPGCRSFIADPVTVDELNDYARVSGSPHMPRQSIWHALNQRATARRYAADNGRRYEDLNLIICHLGGGISVAAHDHGRAVDVNNALDGEGPFSPERAGTLPAADIIRLSYSGRYTQQQLLKRIAGHAGLEAHLGTTDVREIISRIEAGDEHARLILDSMIYHIAKAIAAQTATLEGKVDAIILTGGMAHAPYITDRITSRVNFIAPVSIYPGENEMESLASNARMALTGEIEPKTYR